MYIKQRYLCWICEVPPLPPSFPLSPHLPPTPHPPPSPPVFIPWPDVNSLEGGAPTPLPKGYFSISKGAPKIGLEKVVLKGGPKKREARFFYSGRWLKNECYSNLFAVIKGNSVLSSIAIPGGENRMRVRRVLSHEHSPL